MPPPRADLPRAIANHLAQAAEPARRTPATGADHLLGLDWEVLVGVLVFSLALHAGFAILYGYLYQGIIPPRLPHVEQGKASVQSVAVQKIKRETLKPIEPPKKPVKQPELLEPPTEVVRESVDTKPFVAREIPLPEETIEVAKIDPERPELPPEPMPVEEPIEKQVVEREVPPEEASEVISVASQASQGAVSQVPKAYFNPAPPYPPEAQARGIEGVVELKLMIGTDGRVKSSEIAVASGKSYLDEHTLRYVRDHWVFYPARTASGQAVVHSVTVPVRYRLRDR